MNEAERLHQIHAYLDLIQRHIIALPEKTNPDALDGIARRLHDLQVRTIENRTYSIERRKDAAEARERVSQMIGTVN